EGRRQNRLPRLAGHQDTRPLADSMKADATRGIGNAIAENTLVIVQFVEGQIDRILGLLAFVLARVDLHHGEHDTADRFALSSFRLDTIGNGLEDFSSHSLLVRSKREASVWSAVCGGRGCLEWPMVLVVGVST